MLKLKLLLITSLTTQLIACFNGDSSEKAKEAINPWWSIVTPVTIGNDRYYGKPCSVTRVRDNVATIIFEAPTASTLLCTLIDRRSAQAQKHMNAFVHRSVTYQSKAFGKNTSVSPGSTVKNMRLGAKSAQHQELQTHEQRSSAKTSSPAKEFSRYTQSTQSQTLIEHCLN